MVNDPELFIRLYLDEDVHKGVAAALRLRQFDVISIHEYNLQGLSDEEHLRMATSQRRSIVSFNTVDYKQLHARWLESGQEHAGIIVSEQLPIGETIRRLVNLLDDVTKDEMTNQMRWLQTYK
jgi:hypothetical protein